MNARGTVFTCKEVQDYIPCDPNLLETLMPERPLHLRKFIYVYTLVEGYMSERLPVLGKSIVRYQDELRCHVVIWSGC